MTFKEYKSCNDLTVFAFTSRPSGALSRFEASQIIQKAWSYNVARDITGLLMYANGKFREIIEGPGNEVQALAARIIADKRHQKIAVTRFDSIENRMFDRWHTEGFETLLDELPEDATAAQQQRDETGAVRSLRSRSG